MMSDAISDKVPPAASARHAADAPRGSMYAKRAAVEIIRIPCMKICNAELALTLRTALKYPDRQEHTDIGSRLSASTRKEGIVRSSVRNTRPINPDRVNSRTEPSIPLNKHRSSAFFIESTAVRMSPLPNASATRRVLPRFIPAEEMVMNRP